MTAVGIREGIRYGATLLGYFAVLFIVGGIIVEIGIELFLLDSLLLTVLGALLMIIGGLVIYTGLLGVVYKIIADGVERGIRSAQRPTEETETGSGSGAGQRLIDSVTGIDDRDE